jgi:hypothetical protein
MDPQPASDNFIEVEDLTHVAAPFVERIIKTKPDLHTTLSAATPDAICWRGDMISCAFTLNIDGDKNNPRTIIATKAVLVTEFIV